MGAEKKVTFGSNYNQGQSNTLYRPPRNSQGEMVMQKSEAKDVEESLTKVINDLKRDQGFFRQEITQEIRQEIASVKQECTLSMKNIETQMSQMFRLMSERPWGTLPSNTENNPKERVNVVSVVSPKEEERKDTMEKVCEEDETYTVKVNKQVITSCGLLSKEEETDTSCALKEVEKEAPLSKSKTQTPRKTRLGNRQDFECDGREDFILNTLCRACFVNEDFDSDEEDDLSQIQLSVETSTILHKGCPSKQGDPGAFFVKCVIGDCVFKDDLADLGASVNIMPSHIFESLKFPCIAPTPLVVRLDDGTTRYPRGVVANVLVKVGRNLVPIDFMVLDVGKDLEVPLILGRPFLATCRALIDVGTSKLIFRINGDS
ncbi:PREDICTED: uncharacterized protein LOC109179595 [Ipomoea nil]|uniref:uncharacterized protein LOC109179595 n=1 Tax=Ipomoea nil TaxID=35883 RepID=UPI000900CFF8|nr:PREDICTED: uncharacterized protein LOC109179595 [Ipomoea nil]